MKKKILRYSGVLLVLASFFTSVAAAQESDIEKTLLEADIFYAKGDYLGAIGSYFKASALSTKPHELSRAYYGLALCYFYQRDMAESVKWMRKVALVDPYKTVSADSAPKAFADLFNQVLAEARAKGTPVVSTGSVPAAPPQKPQPEKVEPAAIPVIDEREAAGEGKAEAGKAVEAAEAEKEAEPAKKDEPIVRVEPQKPAALNIPQSAAPAYEDFWAELAGRFEVSVHYSGWTVNPVVSLFEGDLNDSLGKALQNAIEDELTGKYPGLVKDKFSSDLAFDASGPNYGFELRYYSRGRAGTFSFGIGLEKTNIRFSMDGTASQSFTNGGVAQATATAVVEAKPLATHFGFRWEIGSPAARVKPFFTLGFGFAPLDGTFTYSYTGTYALGSASESISDSQTKDFEALSEDIEFDIPKIIVFLQLDFGLKVDIVKSLFVIGQAGLWDGFHVRGGLGYRF